jgi:hypothetical protein
MNESPARTKERAKLLFEEALRIDPSHAIAIINWCGIVLQQDQDNKNYDKALSSLEKILFSPVKKDNKESNTKSEVDMNVAVEAWTLALIHANSIPREREALQALHSLLIQGARSPGKKKKKGFSFSSIVKIAKLKDGILQNTLQREKNDLKRKKRSQKVKRKNHCLSLTKTKPKRRKRF